MERDGKSVLIDGGKSIKSFSNQFKNTTGINFVNYLVCTHNDSDHANGILGFIQDGFRCDEVWLPGSWTYRWKDLLNDNKHNLCNILADEIIKYFEEKDGLSSPLLEDIGDDYTEKLLDNPCINDCSNSIDLCEIMYESELAMEGSANNDDRWHNNLKDLELSLFKFRKLNHKQYELFLTAIEAAERIRLIALSAFHHGIPIRWFEYSPSKSPSGGNDILRPINAVQIDLVNKPHMKFLDYIALSVSNKKCLVFESPKNMTFPGALFLADSDLSFKQAIPANCGLITAPHHGSESNARAYQRLILENVINDCTVWVRSDGNFKSRPGSPFIKAQGRKFCTLCRGTKQRQKQDLNFIINKSFFVCCSGTLSCSCF